MKYDRIGLGALVVRGFAATSRLKDNPGVTEDLDKSIQTLIFNLKEGYTYDQYIAWRMAWRDLYRRVSENIIGLKNHRDGFSGVGGNVWETIRPHRQSDIMLMKRYAHHLLVLRRFSKILAGRSRAAQIAKAA